MDATFKDIGVIHDCSLDMAFGASENDFEATTNVENHVCLPGYYLYIDNTEYGGIIDGVEIDTARDELTYIGRTWHGVLASKIIEPDVGEDYYTVSGDANAVLQQLINRHELDDLFAASSNTADNVNYQFFRYTDLYSGILGMLKSIGHKLIIRYRNSRVQLEAVPLVDYSQIEEFDTDQIDFFISKTDKTVNHIIGLGKGELAAREVVHRYIDGNGNISVVQHYTGLDEVTYVYENTNAEGADLIAETEEKLRELSRNEQLDIALNAEFSSYDIGDIVGAREHVTGLKVFKKINKKIVKISGDEVTTDYEVG